jgi:hypothetical protein
VPFLLEHDDAGRAVLRAHVARANPVWQAARRDVDSLVVFQGPQAYVSPGWYASKAEHGKVAPTWNYVMVQARGKLQVHEYAPWLLSLVTALKQMGEEMLVGMRAVREVTSLTVLASKADDGAAAAVTSAGPPAVPLNLEKQPHHIAQERRQHGKDSK